MSLLNSIVTGPRILPPRVLLYGTNGIGKNTWAAGAPSPIVIQTEQGSDELGMARFPLATDYATVIAQIGALYSDPHDFGTVVLDSADWLEQLIWKQVCIDNGNAVNIAKACGGYGNGYLAACLKWREILDGLKALREHRGMCVILLAHHEVKVYNAPDTDPYDRYIPRLHKYAMAMLAEWVDALLFAGYRVHTKTVETRAGDVSKGIGTGERVLHTQERPSHLAKNRYGLSEPMPFPLVGGFDLFAAGVGAFHAAQTKAAPATAPALVTASA